MAHTINKDNTPLMREAKKQKRHWLGLAGFVVVFLLFVFPPFYYDFGRGLARRQWHFFLDSRYDGKGRHGHVDLNMLFLELALVGMLGGGIYYVVNTKENREC